MMQLADAASELPHVELGSCRYSGFEYTKLVNVMGVDPTFVNVSAAFELPVVPTTTVPRLKLVADNFNALVAVSPVPVSVMVEGLLGSESVITSVPVRVPVVLGVKLI
jgi:hypothetical protein